VDLLTPVPETEVGGAVVAVEEVTRRYRRGAEVVTAVDHVSVAVERGTFVAVVGASGSGKSTLLHLMGGLDRPTEGRVLFEGRDLSTVGEHDLTLLRRRRLGFVFQFFNLLPNLVTWQNMALPLMIDGVRPDVARARAVVLAERLGIAHRLETRASLLSGGEMQRCAIGRAVVADPGLVLADEPTGNLDRRNGQEVLRLLRTLVIELGSSVVMVTHDRQAAGIADRVVELEDGRLVADSAQVGR
jgi:putative ABC transport system ATP-binding protein